ncbi:class C sortase [uncultured Bifidobacterium sp.]|uniref:class C sortase n=1 Tax=uncultured Bifidobacterium sp. TaxID=165187 RepID=UPI0028DC8CF5|nr:class C sortase [uncultured Bifidobacterium sp.]
MTAADPASRVAFPSGEATRLSPRASVAPGDVRMVAAGARGRGSSFSLDRQDLARPPRSRRSHGILDGVLAVIIAVLVVLASCLIAYPSTASWVSALNQSAVVSGGVPASDSDAALDARQLALAERYNAGLGSLASSAVYDAGSNAPSSDDGTALHGLYDKALDAGDGLMGRLQIPSIDVDLPIYHGTSDDTLLQGVGHLEGTSLPVGGSGQHAVLTGHRGLASATMFTHLDKVRTGDEFTVSTFGRVLTYKVVRIQVVDPDETRSLQPVAGEDLVTLVTCTPLGINSQRIFVTGERVTPTPVTAVKAASSKASVPSPPWAAIVVLGIVTADVVWLGRSLKREARRGRHLAP